MQYTLCPVTGCPIVTDFQTVADYYQQADENTFVNLPTPCTLDFNCPIQTAARTLANLQTMAQNHYNNSGYQQEKENTMNTLNIVAHAAQSTERSTEARQKDHLVCRLNDIKYQRREVLRTQFGLDELPRPKTPAELVEYIKTGKYVFKHEEDLENDDFGSSEFYYSPWRYIQFRDPEVKEDRAGYEKACKALEKLYDDTKDEIIVKNPEDALAALRQFESTSIN